MLSKFISLIFWYNSPPFFARLPALWFAFEIYIFDILIQHWKLYFGNACVVICFRNLYLWYSDTTLPCYSNCFPLLWFAFEIYIFDILIQPNRLQLSRKYRCDLLSKFISLIFWYNFILNYKREKKLWFAFEIYIFDILIQPYLIDMQSTHRCDLLSKFISLIFWYNKFQYALLSSMVVICFRNLYLWYSDTT